MRSTILACLALALSLSGCGRSDLFEDEPAGIYDVDQSREVLLDDGELVFVELAAPSDPAVNSALMDLDDGCTFDDLLAAVAPEGELKIKNFGEIAMHIRVDDELRAVIWR